MTDTFQSDVDCASEKHGYAPPYDPATNSIGLGECYSFSDRLGSTDRPTRTGTASGVQIQLPLPMESLLQSQQTGELQVIGAQHVGSRAEAWCSWPGCGKRFNERKNCDLHVESVHGTFDNEGMLVKSVYTCLCKVEHSDMDDSGATKESNGNGVESDSSDAMCGIQYPGHKKNISRHIKGKHLKSDVKKVPARLYRREVVPVREPLGFDHRFICLRCPRSFHDVPSEQLHLKIKHKGSPMNAYKAVSRKLPASVSAKLTRALSTLETGIHQASACHRLPWSSTPVKAAVAVTRSAFESVKSVGLRSTIFALPKPRRVSTFPTLTSRSIFRSSTTKKKCHQKAARPERNT